MKAVSGCVNLSGTLKVEVTSKYEDSTVARIFELVENAANMEKIARRELQLLQDRICAVGIRLELPSVLAAYLAQQCKKQGGARQLRHLLQQKLESPLANLLLKAEKKPKNIVAELVEEEISLHIQTSV